MTGLMTSLSTMMKTGWSYGFDYDWTQLDWYDDSDLYDYGWNDNWTWSTGSGSTPLALQPQEAAASSRTAASSTGLTSVQPGLRLRQMCQRFSHLETGETMTHTPSRRNGTETRPVVTGTGLLSAFVSVNAVMNSFGRPHGLPLIPETVSSPQFTTPDEYGDVLGRHHENCISSLSPKEHWILFDSGATEHHWKETDSV